MQWLVGREDYHRLLKRVYMNGTRNGEPFETYHEYVNFRPRTVYPSLFETCAISPYVSHAPNPVIAVVFNLLLAYCREMSLQHAVEAVEPVLL